MRKYVLIAAFLTMTALHAQKGPKHHEKETNISTLVDQSEYYNLSPEQREKLIARKKRIGREYAAIGRDHSLSGDEKGAKKRELSKQIQADIREILTEEQYSEWSTSKSKHHKHPIEKEDIEHKIEHLEREYEKDYKRIEHQYRNDKSALKREKNIENPFIKRSAKS